MIGRREFIGGCMPLAAAAFSASRLAAASRPSIGEGIDKSLDAAIAFLADQQQPDGAWRSSVYGPLKDGPSLTSLIAATVAACRCESRRPALLRAAEYLAAVAVPE